MSYQTEHAHARCVQIDAHVPGHQHIMKCSPRVSGLLVIMCCNHAPFTEDRWG